MKDEIIHVVAGLLLLIIGVACGWSWASRPTYTVHAFPSDDLTIRIKCSGDCDLAAMIAEAREAVEK